MINSRTPAELKNCKLENPSLLFRPLAQYLGSDKRRVLSPCVTYFIYTSFQLQMSSGKMLYKRNFMRTQTLKVSGNITCVACHRIKECCRWWQRAFPRV